VFPESAHVYDLGLSQKADLEIWEFARKNDYVIVTKDSDFHELTILFGFPPKVIWIRRGNCSTHQIEDILRTNYDLILGIQSKEFRYLILR
jgi:predicted nuclease of predicted toxin-antitoxin system